MPLPQIDTRHVFFTGKGGVGKTSLCCATALKLAEQGRRVLVVSTDPASNLDEVLSTPLGSRPTPVDGVPNLFGLNIDPEAAARDYCERMVAPYRGILPPAAIASMEEQFSGACTVEIAAFDEFAKLLGEPTVTADFDRVFFDTAPTGHTLRLLSLPSAWTEFIASSTGGASCLGPLAGLEKQKALYGSTLQRLSDPAETTAILVSRAETSALREADRTRRELADLGITNLRLAINGVFIDLATTDPIAAAMTSRSHQAVANMPEGLKALARSEIPFRPKGTVGLDALRALDGAATPFGPELAAPTACRTLPADLDALVDEIAGTGRGLVMTMGKGGVGKTSVAAAVAIRLARLGHPVTLSTTDPAAHVADTVEGDIPGLNVGRIDPEQEVAAYRAEVLAKAGAGLDTAARALLEEDLRSPCTEEIAVFRAFARTVAQGEDRFVVLDTAPTGHTILLLDAAEAYHREVMRTQSDLPDAVRSLLPRLRDQLFTRILIVTLAEATPVHEAARLQDDLNRAGIHPFAWVINQCLSVTGTTHPLLAERGQYELAFIEQVSHQLSNRYALIPWCQTVTGETTRMKATLAGGIAVPPTNELLQLSPAYCDGTILASAPSAPNSAEIVRNVQGAADE